MVQQILTIIIGIIAFLYVVKIFIKQFSKVETNPKCDNCPIPELKSLIKTKN